MKKLLILFHVWLCFAFILVFFYLQQINSTEHYTTLLFQFFSQQQAGFATVSETNFDY